MKFPSKTTFILWSLVAKIIIKGGYFGCVWTAKDQNIYLRSLLGHREVFCFFLGAFEALLCFIIIIGPGASSMQRLSEAKLSCVLIVISREVGYFVLMFPGLFPTGKFPGNSLKVIPGKFFSIPGNFGKIKKSGKYNITMFLWWDMKIVFLPGIQIEIWYRDLSIWLHLVHLKSGLWF